MYIYIIYVILYYILHIFMSHILYVVIQLKFNCWGAIVTLTTDS